MRLVIEAVDCTMHENVLVSGRQEGRYMHDKYRDTVHASGRSSFISKILRALVH